MRQRESYYVGCISKAFGKPAEDVLGSMAGLSWDDACDRISAAIGEPIHEDTLRRIFKGYDVPLRRHSHIRAGSKGKHQRVVAAYFNKTFRDVIDGILTGAGVDEMGMASDRSDPVMFVDAVCKAIYGRNPASSQRRSNLRSAILKAMAERSQLMGLRFHMRPDFPTSVVRLPADIDPPEEAPMHNPYDIEDVLPKISGMKMREFIQVGDGHILVFEAEKGPVGIKMMPSRATDGRLVISYELLAVKDVQQYAARQLSNLGAQRRRAETIMALLRAPAGGRG